MTKRHRRLSRFQALRKVAEALPANRAEAHEALQAIVQEVSVDQVKVTALDEFSDRVRQILAHDAPPRERLRRIASELEAVEERVEERVNRRATGKPSVVPVPAALSVTASEWPIG